MFRKRGQGTIEYLVIIAIVVVIALVVVGLLLQVMDQGSGIPEATAKTAWKSAQPWAITDWDQNTTALALVLKNNSYESMELEDVHVNGTAAVFEDFNVSSGATSTVYVALTATTAGDKYSYAKANIYITYNTANINGKNQYALADIVGTVS